MNDLIPIDDSYLDALKEKSKIEQSYFYILNKINQTLDAFGIRDKRDAFSEALIRLTMLEFEFPMHGSDPKTRMMFDMLDYFKKIANE